LPVIFNESAVVADFEKYLWLPIARRTNAITSEKVASLPFEYQAVDITLKGIVSLNLKAMSVTIENNPISNGVVLAMALSDHCLWVSTPR
jgi:hypothetical protein